MNFNQNQLVFEEFQKSVNQARILAQKLGPEHFYLAYDRCAKLQKVIFKRACGYCFSSDDANDFKDKGNNENQEDMPINQKPIATNLSYLNLPGFSLCGSNFPLLISGQSAINSQLDFGMKKLVLLKWFTDTIPSKEEEDLLDKAGCVIHQPHVSLSESLKEFLHKLMKYFPDHGDSQYEICLPQTSDPALLGSITEDGFSKLQNSCHRNSCFFLRPKMLPNKAVKLELSVPSPSNPNSDNSTTVTKINSFMADAEKIQNHSSDDVVIPEPFETSVFPDTIFPVNSIDVRMADECKSRSTRRYNWSVVLSNLHENHPTQLRNESVRFPDICHELHAIPPTPQKLRPTKRCQLCLKGYKSRKESRYYCRQCDKGFHIKCFEVYHQQLGYGQYKVKIISGER